MGLRYYRARDPGKTRSVGRSDGRCVHTTSTCSARADDSRLLRNPRRIKLLAEYVAGECILWIGEAKQVISLICGRRMNISNALALHERAHTHTHTDTHNTTSTGSGESQQTQGSALRDYVRQGRGLKVPVGPAVLAMAAMEVAFGSSQRRTLELTLWEDIAQAMRRIA